jgi:putative sigma-54 modulation protein
MNIEITSRNYEPSKRVRDHAEERITKFDKYLRDLSQIRLTLSEEKVAKLCEIHLRAYGKDFHSHASAEDMLQSVDRACASMERQLSRHRDRLTDQRKGSKPPISSAAEMERLAQAELAHTDGDDEEY